MVYALACFMNSANSIKYDETNKIYITYELSNNVPLAKLCNLSFKLGSVPEDKNVYNVRFKIK